MPTPDATILGQNKTVDLQYETAHYLVMSPLNGLRVAQAPPGHGLGVFYIYDDKPSRISG